MLNKLFGYKKKNTQSNISYKNKNIVKITNNIIYNLIFVIYTVLSVFIHPFQRRFINLYTIYLQTNRLPYRIVPNHIKFVLTLFVDIDSWILFFKRIKNNQNLYIIREKKHPFLHRLWCIYFRNKTVYYPELNIKRSHSNTISNFFYKTRLIDKNTNKTITGKYKVVLFYYINKLVIQQYPYLYWTYIFIYNKYNYSKNAVNISQHVRTQIFFLFLQRFNQFTQFFKKISFVKFNFYTFQGIKKTIKKISLIKNYSFVLKNKQKKDNIMNKYEDIVKLLDKNFIKIFYKKIEPKKPQIKFYINYIIYTNVINFKKFFENVIINKVNFLKIQWYTKLHNNVDNKKTNIVLYLRAAKHFNKGRYSRNRQLYRTGVYWCIWLNIVLVYALHFYFYRIVFSFGYLWIPLSFMILTIFSSRLYKYRYYDINQIVIEFKEFNNFLFQIFLKLKHVFKLVFIERFLLLKSFLVNYTTLFYKFFEFKFKKVITFFKNVMMV